MLRHFPFLNRTPKNSGAQKSRQNDIPHLPDLILAAGKLAIMLQPGRHGQRKRGTGEDFWQFRAYNPQEPASLIDWKQSARSPDETVLWVKEREKQVPRHLCLWVDPSASMKWRSSEKFPTKYDTAMIAALALGQAALHAGESVSVLGEGRFLTGTHFLPELALNLEHVSNDLPALRMASPYATIILVSDFLWDEATLEELSRNCQSRPGRTLLLAVLDPAECNFPYQGSLKFTSQENEPALAFAADEHTQKQYQTLLAQHFGKLSQISRKLPGVFYHFHHNEQPLLPSLLTLWSWIGDKA